MFLSLSLSLCVCVQSHLPVINNSTVHQNQASYFVHSATDLYKLHVVIPSESMDATFLMQLQTLGTADGTLPSHFFRQWTTDAHQTWGF